MRHLRQEFREHCIHIGLYDEVIVERLHLLHLTSLLSLLTSLLKVLLRLLRGNHARQVALVIGIQLRLDVDWQEGLTGENLRTSTLEVMIDELHLVDLTVPELLSQ